MIKKFECKSCGKQFSSEETELVKCPHCGSDNVDYAHIHLPYKYIGFLICLVLIVVLLLQIDFHSIIPWNSSKIDNPTTVVDDPRGETPEEITQEIENLGIEIKPTIIGVDQVEIDDNGNYSFIVKIEHAPQKGYAVVITDKKSHKEIAKSDDGKFKGIPYSRNGGKYDVQIVNASSGEELGEQTEITGFVQVEHISTELSKAKLQELINRQDSSLLGLNNKYLSPVYKIQYKNLPKGSDYVPDNFADVFEMIDMEAWTSVEVISLDYDNTKHISSIILQVNAPSRTSFDNE